MGKILATGLALVALGACGSDDGGSSGTTTTVDVQPGETSTTTVEVTTTTIATAGPEIDSDGNIVDRMAISAFLQNTIIGLGADGTDIDKVTSVVQQTYAGTDVQGGDFPADSTTISILSTTQHGGAASADDPYMVVFAVADTSGACTGGGAFGYPTVTDSLSIDNPPSCTAQAVYEQAQQLLG